MVWAETLGTAVAVTYVSLTMRLRMTLASEFPSTECPPLEWVHIKIYKRLMH